MYALVIHGGAGLSTPEDLGAEREVIARVALAQALQAGENILKAGGSALDATIAAVCVMEDSEVFNAGKGSVFASDGVQYMDASLMDGANKRAGSLCGATRIRNPIRAAKLVMEHTRHVMLYGEDVHRLAEEHNIETVEPTWFHTQYRADQLQRAIAANTILLDHESVESHSRKATSEDNCKGTVGAVALDLNGNVAAATSTGGLVNKRPGRVGDSAIIGAGTYALNSTCAVSATGHGELFIRSHVASRLSDLIELAGLSLKDAANQIVFSELPDDCGGVIAVDQAGNIALPFNTGGMFRGYVKQAESPVVEVWKEG